MARPSNPGSRSRLKLYSPSNGRRSRPLFKCGPTDSNSSSPPLRRVLQQMRAPGARTESGRGQGRDRSTHFTLSRESRWRCQRGEGRVNGDAHARRRAEMPRLLDKLAPNLKADSGFRVAVSSGRSRKGSALGSSRAQPSRWRCAQRMISSTRMTCSAASAAAQRLEFLLL